MNLAIDKILYIFIYFCIAMIMYNIYKLLYLRRMKKNHYIRVNVWENEIRRQITAIRKRMSVEQNHMNKIDRKLKNTTELYYYECALDKLRKEGDISGYIKEVDSEICALANHYIKKENIEQAFFTLFISKHINQNKKFHWRFIETILLYLENSTIYCRENALRVLYTLGNVQAVENAFQIINDRQWFHHRKFLSDGLMMFTGNKEELAERLWSHHREWNDNLMVSVVNFITNTSGNFKERFYVNLKSKDTKMEIRLAILRYFQCHFYEPVRTLLLAYIKGENKVNECISIVSATVAERYPGEDVIEALKKAVFHPNWYLRNNATRTLVALNVKSSSLSDILKGEDHYAKEILGYAMGL